MADDRLSQDEVAAVLRRAAELDAAVGAPADERLPVAAVEAAASEVGLAPGAVRQAVAELRAGVLPATVDATATADLRAVVEAAVLPLEVAAAVDAVGRWLSAQTFQRHRGRDGVEVWRVREDWLAGVQRKFDWAGSVKLGGVREVVVRAVAVEGGTLVRLEAMPTGAVQAAPGIGAAALGVSSSAGTGVLAAVASTGGTVPLAVATGGLALGGFGGWITGRAVRRTSRARTADELSAALDRLASGADDRTAFDRLRERARRSRAPWMRA